MQIELHPAAAEDKPALVNLVQLYLHDLGDYGGPAPDAHGRYQVPDLDLYLSRPDRAAFLIHAEGRLAGFALVHQNSRLHGAFEGHVVESLFVLRGLRRRGIGAGAAAMLFERLPGRWEVATPAANIPATAFWRAVSQRYTLGLYEELWYQHNGWRGTVETFAVPPVALR
jgi:predicted acetyltransferase